MTRRQYIAAFAIAPLLRAAGTYRSLAEALAHREEAVTMILNRTSVTDDVSPLKNLRSLILNANDLEVLPPGIDKLHDLRAIFIGGSPRLEFRHSIEVLARLPKLEGVGLDNNQMRVVPENIGQLKSCKRLGLSSNGLNALHDSISDLSALETLDVYNNQLRNVPAGLRNLSHLKRVYVLNCGLSKEALEKSLEGVELNTDVPAEVYLQLK